jgi:hypothetical protein
MNKLERIMEVVREERELSHSNSITDESSNIRIRSKIAAILAAPDIEGIEPIAWQGDGFFIDLNWRGNTKCFDWTINVNRSGCESTIEKSVAAATAAIKGKKR